MIIITKNNDFISIKIIYEVILFSLFIIDIRKFFSCYIIIASIFLINLDQSSR